MNRPREAVACRDDMPFLSQCMALGLDIPLKAKFVYKIYRNQLPIKLATHAVVMADASRICLRAFR